ncbi:MAG: protein kinase [Planctomycetes bacterium]|nr:protein kinase [Planctomycetota bacterium]
MSTLPLSPEPLVPPTLPVAPPAPPPPKRVGPYSVLETLGQGGMGQVLLAEDVEGKKVALKLLAPWASDVDARRFEREARLLASLSHPNVVGFVDHGVDPASGDPYIALELVAGRDLDGALAARPAGQPMLPEEAIFVLERVARALTAVHALGIVHRDVKPANVLITADGEVKLTDFGIALPREVSVRVTAPDEVVGTVHYVAPELLADGAVPTAAADLYALGALAWRLFTGELLFQGRSIKDVLVAHLKETPPPLATRCPELDPAVAALVDRLLAKAPEDRPTAAEVAEALAPVRPHTTLIARLWAAEEAAARRRTIGERLREQEPVTLQQYRIERELGRGGMGVVYLAWHLGLKRPVALKTMLAGALASADERRRFLKEAEAVAALIHPNIVRVLDAGQAGETCFLAMEYVAGRPLSHVMREEPRDLRRLVGLLAGIAGGVHHAHTCGVVHRDLKPDNIIVDEAGAPRVLDFGMAKRLGDVSVNLTAAGAIIGTVHYMPPEQAAGRSAHADARSDVWSLGAILYEMLTGTTPYLGGTQDVLVKIGQEDPPQPSARRPGLPWELEAIAMKALERDPGGRYPSARALQEDLERWLEGRPIVARPASATYLVKKWAARHSHHLALVALAVALVLGGAGAFAWEGRRRERARRDGAAATAVEGLRRLARGDAVDAAAAFDRARAALRPGEALRLPLGTGEADLLEGEPDVVDEARLDRWAKRAVARQAAARARGHARDARAALADDRLDEAAEALALGHVLAPDEPELAAAQEEALARFRRAARLALDRAYDLPVARLEARGQHLDEARNALELAERAAGRQALTVTRGLLDEERAHLERDHARARLAEEAARRRRELERTVEVRAPTSPTVADGEDPAVVVVRVSDEAGRPREGCPVRFEAHGPGHLLDPERTTDRRGEAHAHLVSTVAGVTTLSVTVVIGEDEVPLSQRPRVVFRAGAPDPRASTITATRPELVADGAAVVSLSVVLRDRAGNPVPGARVALSATGRGSTLTAPDPTGADGAALATLASTVAEVKTITAVATTATGDDVPLEASAVVRFLPGRVDASASTIAAAPTSLVADGAQVTTITVCARDAHGNPVPGQVVRLGATGSGNALVQPELTGEDGLALGLLASTVAEVKTVTVLVNPGAHQVALPRATTIEFGPGPLDPTTSSVQVAPGEDGAAEVVVIARDALGNPIPGLRVELGAPGATVAQPDGVTSERGEARGQVRWARAAQGEVTATVFTRGGPVRLTASGGP